MVGMTDGMNASTTRLRRSLVAVVAGIGVAVLATASADAAPTWLSPQNLFPTAVTSIQQDPYFNRAALDVGTDAAGNSVAVWIQFNDATHCQAWWSARPAAGDWSAPQPLSAATAGCGSAGDPRTNQIKLAMNPSGTAVAAWQFDGGGALQDVIQTATRPPGGSFGTPQTLSSCCSFDPAVAINDAGTTVVTWDDNSTNNVTGEWFFNAAVRQAGGGFGAPETVSETTGGTTQVFVPRVAIDATGDVIAVWVNDFTAATVHHDLIETAYRPAGGHFPATPSQVLRDIVNTNPAPQSYAGDVAFDSAGRATAVWPFFPAGSPAPANTTIIESATRGAGTGGTFPSSSFYDQVSSPTDGGTASNVHLAVDPAVNRAAAVWARCDSPTSCRVEGSARGSGGSFQDRQILSGPGAVGSFGPLVAFDPFDASTATWSGPDAGTGSDFVQATERPAGDGTTFSLTPTRVSATPAAGVDDISPAIAYDGEGNAVAIWQHKTSATSSTIQYAGFDAAPPTITSFSAGSGVAGQAIPMSASAFDRWTGAVLTWNFGDGQGGSGGSVSHVYANHGTYGVTVTATDGVGNSTSAGTTITVACPSPPPGVTFDVNCVPIPKPPTPRITSPINNTWLVNGRSITAVVLTAGNVPEGATITITCKGKPRCRFKKKTIHVKKTGKVNLLKALGRRKNRRFKAGERIEIRITKPGYIGKDVVFKLKKGKIPKGTVLCIKPSASKPSSC